MASPKEHWSLPISISFHFWQAEESGYFCMAQTSSIRREKIQNKALFPRLGLPSTLICLENESFRKRSLNRENFKTPALRFLRDRKEFEREAFRKRLSCNNHDIFKVPAQVLLKHKFKMTGDCFVVKFLVSCKLKTFDASEWYHYFLGEHLNTSFIWFRK